MSAFLHSLLHWHVVFMAFVYLAAAGFTVLIGQVLLEHFFQLPEARAIVDVNARCPACGHRQGKLNVIFDANMQTHIQHECLVCHARFTEPTIVKAEFWIAREPITVKR